MSANSHGPASKRLEKIYAAHLEDAWFRAAFYTKDTLTEEKARCQLLHVELPIENLTPGEQGAWLPRSVVSAYRLGMTQPVVIVAEVEAPNSFLLITSSKDVRELLLEVACECRRLRSRSLPSPSRVLRARRSPESRYAPRARAVSQAADSFTFRELAPPDSSRP